MKKYSIDYVKSTLAELGYFLFEDQEYTDCKKKLSFCDIEGYKYRLSLDSVFTNIRTKQNLLYRFSTRNIFTIDNIILWISKNNKSFVLMSNNFTRSSDRNLIFKCLLCGKEWGTSWNDISSNKGCPPCSKKRVGLQKRIPLSEVLKKFEENDIKILREEDYVLTEQKIDCQCIKCGYLWKTDYHHVSLGDLAQNASPLAEKKEFRNF